MKGFSYATKTLMCSLVLSKQDYCNSLLSGYPQYFIQLFQRVQNTAARITLRAPRAEHTSSSFTTFTSCLYNRESSTKSALFVMLH